MWIMREGRETSSMPDGCYDKPELNHNLPGGTEDIDTIYLYFVKLDSNRETKLKIVI